ncbi:MAG: diguanylate cyclase [Eubacteriales bacterium]|nr:diguanylate cyclase [Eubacteriales bacterium]MDD3880736.1 diguanylate cyclase [Eubacteriales bacterium]MDD4511630.1 diguanylate cyclase [Eubacteriales bacterium]
MTDFKILSYIRKWYIPIIILSLAGCFLFSRYIGNKQTYNASVIISYTNSGASSGLTPSGERIDVNQITASNVISGAINELGIKQSIDFIRSRFSITEIIPDDEETRKTALLERGEEYSYFPTKYMIDFTVGASFSEEYARRVLESVIRTYIQYYGEKYVDLTITPDNVNNTTNGAFDYLESVELVDSGLSDIIDYLYQRRDAYPNFYCSTVGYSFGNILDLYMELRDLNIDKLYALIMDGRVTRDAETLTKEYQHRLEKAQIDRQVYSDKLAGLEPIIESYTEKSTQGQQTYNYDGLDEEGNTNSVMTFVSGTHSSKQTTYDALMNDYVEFNVQLGLCDEEIKYCKHVIDVFSTESSVNLNTVEMQREVDKILSDVTEKSNELYETLKTMISEFNEYNSVQNITTQSTISVSEGMNTQMYIIIALVLFIVVGCCSSVILGRVSEIAKQHIYVDQKTGLPNRTSCDNEIDRLSQKPLGNDMVVIAIQLLNLERINDQSGRRQGDIMLKNFGIIMTHCSKDYGFVGNNGGVSFIGLFEQCKYQKAQSFMTSLTKTIANYNAKYPETPIEIRSAMCESEREGIYNIRELLKHTMSRLFAKDGGKK